LEAPPALRTVRVQISPPTAKVEVDGAARAVVGGFVELSGALGSSHSLHASVGSRQSTEQIAIAESGAVPARIDVGVAAPVGRPTPAHVDAAVPAAQPPELPHAALPPVAKPPKAAAGLTVDKQFE